MSFRKHFVPILKSEDVISKKAGIKNMLFVKGADWESHMPVDSKDRVLAGLISGQKTISQIAEEIGMSIVGVTYNLKKLMRDEKVTSEEFEGGGRFGKFKVYALPGTEITKPEIVTEKTERLEDEKIHREEFEAKLRMIMAGKKLLLIEIAAEYLGKDVEDIDESAEDYHSFVSDFGHMVNSNAIKKSRNDAGKRTYSFEEKAPRKGTL